MADKCQNRLHYFVIFPMDPKTTASGDIFNQLIVNILRASMAILSLGGITNASL